MCWQKNYLHTSLRVFWDDDVGVDTGASKRKKNGEENE